MNVHEAVKVLLAKPADLVKARQKLPLSNGLYAWWALRGSIPGVPENPHPEDEGLDLFYVGIAPKDASSTASLNSRVLNNHMGGNTGSSTFRLTLASLLMDALELTPRKTKTKYVLPPEQNKVLSEWQKKNLRLTWVEHDEPWTIEDDVVAELKPPLNLAGNSSHPFHSTLKAARSSFREAAV